MKSTIMIILALASIAAQAGNAPPAAAERYRAILTREAHLVNGLSAPVPMYAAQIEQESGWRPGITAWDNGRGLAQFMDTTAGWLVKQFPSLGKPAPYSPGWAIPALIHYDTWLAGKVQGIDACQRRAAGLKAYNAGLGTVLYAQKRSPAPGQWFGLTEYVKTRQNARNFEASRMYPRWILQRRQPKYSSWGIYTCEEVK